MGAYPADDSGLWTPPDYWDAEDLALGMEDRPSVWTDGIKGDYPTGGFEVAGDGVYLPAADEASRGAIWCTVEEYGDARLDSCRAFVPVPGPLQTVHRAEFSEAILAGLLAWTFWVLITCNVVRSIGRLLDHGSAIALGQGW